MIRFGGKLVRCFASFSRNLTVNPLNSDNSRPTTCARNNFSSVAPLSSLSSFDLDGQIKKIDQNVRKTGRISIKDLEEILEEIRSQKHVTSSQSLLLLRCCGSLVPEESSEVRTHFAKEIWDTLNALDVPMDISHYNALLRVYLENEYLFSPIDFLEDLKSKGFEPNRVTYQRLIRRYCQQGDLDGATQILKFMQEKTLPVNEHVFNALIVGHSQANDIKSSKGILTVMKQAGLEPTSETYVTLMCCLAKHGLVDEIFSTLEECDKNNILILDKDLLEIIYNLATNSHLDRIPEILGKLQKSRGFNQDCINVILRLISKEKEDIAYEIFKVMPRTVNENGEITDTGNFLIRQLVKSSRPISKIVDICTDMKNNNFNTKAFEVAYEAGITFNTIDVMKLLYVMKENDIEIRQHFFWPVVCRANNENELVQILTEMKEKFGIESNTETLRDYIIPKLKQKNSDSIIDLLSKAGISHGTAAISTAYWTLSSNNLKETVQIMENHKAVYPIALFKNQLFSAFSKSGDVDSFVKFLNAACMNLRSKESAKQLISEVTLEVVAVSKTNKIEQVEEVLNKLLENNLGITSECAENIQTKLESQMTENISNILSKLISVDFKNKSQTQKFENMSVEELEDILEKNRFPSKTNYLKRCLINACFDTKDLGKIEQVLKDLQQTGFTIPSGAKAQLIDLYCNLERIDDALNLYTEEKSKKSDFQLDAIKTLKMADLIFKQGNSDKAIAFLIENKKESLNDEISFVYKNTVWKLLNNLAETGNADLLKKVFDVLESNNYLKPSNVVLGPLIKVHLKNDNISAAMDTFAEICEKYRSTPWKNEIACRLIQSEDAVNLQKLTDLSTTIHGEVNSLYDLVFSFIECGRIRQARKILETPGLQNRSNRISSACERYRSGGDTKSLEALVEATANINYIDRNLIFFNLLQRYQKENDPQKALNLWTKMQEENIVPTDTFLIRLSNFLKENNMEVPFAIPNTQKTAIETKDKHAKQPKKSTEAVESKKTVVQKPESKKTDKTENLPKAFEQLLKDNKLPEASLKMKEIISQNINIPNRIIKFYLNKLANNGDFKNIEEMVLSEDIKKKISFDNRLCHAYIKAGKVKEYFAKLRSDLESCKNEEEVQKQGAAFPRGGALGILEQFPDMYDEYKKLAVQYASHNIKGPMNILWIHNIVKNNIEEANTVFKQHLKDEPRLMFQKILQHARETSNEKTVSVVLASVKGSKISEGALGNIYSCALDILTKQEEVSKAMTTLNDGLKDICLENFNRTALIRLKDLCEKKGVEFPHTISDKTNSSSSSSSSSDDDIVEPKPSR
ncbi:LRPPRC family protein [Megaselia abdita]